LNEEDKRAQESAVVSDVDDISSGFTTEPSHETSPSGEAEPLITADLATPPEGLFVGDILSGVNAIELESQGAEDEEESPVQEQNLEGVDTNLDLSPTQEGRNAPSPIYDDPSDSDDGEGAWITPSNVALHKSRALELLPADDVISKKGKGKEREPLRTGCMTADFAMQNVLLQMGLNLVGLEGKRIEKVKSWVLRCHACFKCAPSISSWMQ
jgi:RNA-binding protein NOB1